VHRDRGAASVASAEIVQWGPMFPPACPVPSMSSRGARCDMLAPMKSGVFNLGFGLVAVAAGATGQFKLLGTDSSTLLIVAGALVATLGVFQLWKNRGK
jgi:hypothetical protein